VFDAAVLTAVRCSRIGNRWSGLDGSWAADGPDRGGAITARESPKIGHNAAVHPSVEAALPQIRELCERLGVARLDLFGSASGPEPAEDPGDVDVLVQFDRRAGGPTLNTYFQLVEGLEALLGKHVDVVTADGLDNPYFRAQVLAQREQLYAA
jgi:predicted nucleotidyltransferase